MMSVRTVSSSPVKNWKQGQRMGQNKGLTTDSNSQPLFLARSMLHNHASPQYHTALLVLPQAGIPR